jgi:cytochrome b
MNLPRIRVWDLPTRLFHWSLVLLVAGAIITGTLGGNLMVWHGRIGICICGLIAFRIVWGIAGSTYARFAQFLPTPGRILAYLRGQWHEPGHNPLGALSVFGLLGIIGFQIATGLAANDDIAFNGPLYNLVSRELSDQLVSLHRISSNLLFVLIGLHVAAIMFYAHVKKDNLVKPMITGWKEKASGRSATGGGGVALIVALAFAAAASYGASGAWLPPPPAAPPAATPSW